MRTPRLNHTNIDILLEEVRGETVPQRVGRHALSARCGKPNARIAGALLRGHIASPMDWHVTILTKDLSTLLSHARLVDWEAVEAYCTEERHSRLDTVILVRPPANCHEDVFTWD